MSQENVETFKRSDETFKRDEMWLEYSEIHGAGDRVVGIGRLHTCGKASGAETEVPFALVGEYIETARRSRKLSKPLDSRSSAMSEENVEIVRSIYQPGDPNRFFELLHEGVQVDMITGTPGMSTLWSPSRSSMRARIALSWSTMNAGPGGKAGAV